MTPSLSVIIVSFNTKDLLAECLTTLLLYTQNLTMEIIVVDNASKDGSAQMIKDRFPQVGLIESAINLGFAAANNLGFKISKGRYLVLLNSDAFIQANTMQLAFKYMEEDPLIGLGGGRLIGKDGSWQPSARRFPSLLNDFLHLSGLAAKYAHSRFFGRADTTWQDPTLSITCDWVPGAFSIIRRDVLEKVRYFDERFFLYYEEVDLCKKIKKQGYEIFYWGDVVLTHLGGESSKTLKSLSLTTSGSMLTLWRMRSQLLYYRKHKGLLITWLSAQLEIGWHRLRKWKNNRTKPLSPENNLKVQDAEKIITLMNQAWTDTEGGKRSPPKPW